MVIVLNNKQPDILQPQGALEISAVTSSCITYAIWQFAHIFHQ